MSEQQTIKGACQHCNGRIAFPPAAHGKTIQCPHCAKPTQLQAPAGDTPASSVAGAQGATQAVSAGDGQVKMSCPHCSGRLQYPAEAAGSLIACPHCTKQVTLLGVPGAPVRPAPAPVEPVAATPAPAPGTLPKARIPAAKRPSSGNGGKIAKNIAIGAVSIAAVVGITLGVAKFVKNAAGEESGSGPTGEGLQMLAEPVLQKAVDGGLTYVVGSVTNFDTAQYFEVNVRFELFDANNQLIGEASDYNGNIAGRAGWDFQALVLEENAASVKFVALEGEKDGQ